MDKAFDKADVGGSVIPLAPGPHCAAGEIQYGLKETGILLYVKASLSGDEGDYILDYKRRYRAFPHETTGDPFFGEEQLEAYRAPGFHIMKDLLTEETPFAVVQDPEGTGGQEEGAHPKHRPSRSSWDTGETIEHDLKKSRTSRMTRLKRMILIEPRLAQDFFARA